MDGDPGGRVFQEVHLEPSTDRRQSLLDGDYVPSTTAGVEGSIEVTRSPWRAVGISSCGGIQTAAVTKIRGVQDFCFRVHRVVRIRGCRRRIIGRIVVGWAIGGTRGWRLGSF
jgi:hypothetical protein